MKKAFTIIELVFVIVILGTLAAVIIPKLNATRDDAELAKAASNISTIIGDLASYYTSRGELSNDLKSMTNVLLDNQNNFSIKNKTCLKFILNNSSITIQAINENDELVCKNLLQMPSIQAILTAKNPSDESKTSTITKAGDSIKIDLSTSSVVW